MTPREVDELGIVDFYILLDGIKNRLEMRAKSAEGGVWIP